MVKVIGFFIFTKMKMMKNTYKITLALAAIGTAAIVVYAARRLNEKRMMVQVADEGYETAHDILFPGKAGTGGQLRFGPVLPA